MCHAFVYVNLVYDPSALHSYFSAYKWDSIGFTQLDRLLNVLSLIRFSMIQKTVWSIHDLRDIYLF